MNQTLADPLLGTEPRSTFMAQVQQHTPTTVFAPSVLVFLFNLFDCTKPARGVFLPETISGGQEADVVHRDPLSTQIRNHSCS